MAKSKKVKEMESMPVASKDSGMSDYEHEDNARTVKRAHEIMADPVKMKGVKKHIKKEKRAIKSIDDMVKYRNDKYGAKGNPDLEVDNDEV